MTEQEAIDRITSVLAYDTWQHVEAAKEMPRLRENTRYAAEQNRLAAVTMDIEEQYQSKLANLGVTL